MEPLTSEADTQAALQCAFERIAGYLRDSGDTDALVPESPDTAPTTLLTNAFGLSSFEADMLLLIAGAEMSTPITDALAEQPRTRSFVDFATCLSHLPRPHWDAITPARPLRRWRLIEVGDESAPMRSPLRMPERVLHFIAGVDYLDPALVPLLAPSTLRIPLAACHARQVGTLFARVSGNSTPAFRIQVIGEDVDARVECAHRLADLLGAGLLLLDDARVGAWGGDPDWLARLVEREALLSSAVVAISTASGRLSAAATTLADNLHVSTMLLADESTPLARSAWSETLARPSAAERVELWREALGEASLDLNGSAEHLAARFKLRTRDIETIGAEIAMRLNEGEAHDVAIRRACGSVTRTGLADLAERIEPHVCWDDLILPEAQRDVLRQICAQVRARHIVYGEWGFASGTQRGQGISALFSGESGTGKTLAAEVVAGELGLDLYRIDLSSVVSKFIGETEKNLRRVFDIAEGSGAVLLFDEADALFGKRSEIRDSHDRYANIEISYLLQRMETYQGLAILTTNQRSALDRAFERRLRFIVNFPFPSPLQRAAIWRRSFPRNAPLSALDFERLAELNVTGGLIRNIAVNAAFLAADESVPVSMGHLARAARTEITKSEHPSGDAQIRKWV